MEGQSKQMRMDMLYMDIATRVAKMSYGIRAQVGAVLVQGDRIISYGWNGTPSGDDNTCEIEVDSKLVTKAEVLHSESNCLMKLASTGGEGSLNSTMYVTMSPCFDCAKLIKQAKIKRVVFGTAYRDSTGIAFLRDRGVVVDQLPAEEL